MAYATTAQLKAAMNKTTAGDDTVLDRLLDAATVWIDRVINQHKPGFDFFDAPAGATARVYGGSGKAWQRIDPCIEITLVAVKTGRTAATFTDWTTDNWIAYRGSHQHPNFNDLPFTSIMTEPGGDFATFLSGRYGTIHDYFPSMARPVLQLRGRNTPTVQVTARWGYSDDPPADIVDVCIMQAARWYKREQSAMADALAAGELGILVFRLEMDPDIAAKLKGGRHFKPALGVR